MKRFSTVLMTDQNDGIFETLKMLVGGTTAVRISKLLNFAVSQMSDDECYVETGVFTGGTLISSYWANGKTCIGIDPYGTDGADMVEATVLDSKLVRKMAIRNIAGMAAGAQLIQKDFRNVKPEEIPKKIAVSFVDAKHKYQDVMDNLQWLDPLLADDALIFFDDINFYEVSDAISRWQVEHHERYDLVVYIKPFYHDGAYMSSAVNRILNNGLCVLRHHRNPLSTASLSHAV